MLWKHSYSQDTCKPLYNLPVQKMQVMDKLQLAYVEKGSGQPIIFIHGLGGNLSHWLKQVNALSNKFKCIAVDLPGYGYSDKSFTTTKNQLAFYADVLYSFIEKKGLKNVTLAGHSMGGQIAMMMAIEHPKKIAKIILAAPAGLETFSETEGKMMMAATPASLFEKQEEPVIRYNFKQNFYQQPSDAELLIQDRLRLKSCTDFKQYTAAVSNSIIGMLQHPVKQDLQKIKQPVLIIFGKEDALIPNKIFHASFTKEALIADAMKWLPHAKLVWVAAAGHLVQYEKSQETTIAINNFLQKKFQQLK